MNKEEIEVKIVTWKDNPILLKKYRNMLAQYGSADVKDTVTTFPKEEVTKLEFTKDGLMALNQKDQEKKLRELGYEGPLYKLKEKDRVKIILKLQK